jgi:hypothetical protein
VRRYWWVFGIVAVLAGLYHAVMSGYLTERQMALMLRHGARQPTVDEQYMDLRKLEQAISKHDRRTAVLRSLTADSPTEGITEARAAVRKQLARLEPLVVVCTEGPEVQTAFDRTARFFGSWEPPSMSCLSPKAYLWSSVIFWVSFPVAALSGLVRLFAGPAD